MITMTHLDINSENILDTVNILKVLAHPVRLCIAIALMKNGIMNVSAIQEYLALPQSTVSQHISKMRQVGLVTDKRDGTKIFYELTNPKAVSIINVLSSEH